MANYKISYKALTDLFKECESLLTKNINIDGNDKRELLEKLTFIRNNLTGISTLENALLYRLIFEEAPVGIVQYNSEGVITTCNYRFIRIIGSSAEKLIGLNMLNLPDQDVVKAVKKSLNGKTGLYEGNYKSVTAEKTTPLRAKFTPIGSGINNNQGGIGIVEDVTENFLALAALSESRSRYQTLFENNHSILLIIDPVTGFIFDANPAAESFYGWNRETLRNMSINEIDTNPYNEVKSSIKNFASSPENYSQAIHRLSDGTTRQVEIAGGEINFVKRNLVYLIVHDISERVQMQESLRKFELGLDRSSHPVFITDIEGKIQYINAAFEDLYGFSKKEAIGKKPSILKSEKQSDEFYKDFWETILSGKVSSGEIINKTKNGDLVTVIYSSNPIINEHGKIIGFIAIHDDITERIKMEEAIRQSLYEKEIMLAEIHHRVKNNLALVSAMMVLQAENSDNNELKGKLHDSANRIKAISNIHEHLYSTSNFASIDFIDNTFKLIENILSTLQTDTEITIEKRSGSVFININQGVYCSLIINEVVTNIVKHAMRGSRKGTIGIKAKEKDGIVIVVISDDGHPLPEEFQSENFSSLGMELIHILARQLDGTFGYNSINGETHFTLSFKKADNPKKKFSSGK
ncbi:MAG: PAS domain S-box protein [Balneolaceae bacterium]|nr:MAG: PAS domain S-box protein [Balneolaceae bacterium]